MLLSIDQTLTTESRRLPSPERSLKVTPLDLRQLKLSTAMRGYDKAEVKALMIEGAEAYEQALRENDQLRQEIGRLDASLAQFRELESGLRSTLISAQKVADDIRDNAVQEAARIVREAEGRADLQIQLAESRRDDIERQIDGLKMQRREAEAGIESLIATLHCTLDFIKDQGIEAAGEEGERIPSCSLRPVRDILV